MSLVTPLTPADPTWKRLADQMLDTDPGLKERAKQLEQKMCLALARKRQRVEELFRWQQAASTSIATITSSLGTLSELSRQRQSIDQGLNPAVKGYLEETKERARDILGESIYWFVKSYQYEFLKDVGDTFYNFDAWIEKLRKMELANKERITTGGAGVSGKAETVVLDKSEFKEIGDQVYRAETLRLGGALMETRQTRGETVSGDYKSCVIERLPTATYGRRIRPKVLLVEDDRQRWMREMLDRLLQDGEFSFNFVTDFEKGSFALNDARVVDVHVSAFEIKTEDRNLTLTIRVVNSGQSVIAQRTADGQRKFFAFQSGKDDQPIFWQYQYNQSEPPGSRLSPSPSTNIVSENVKALFVDPGKPAAKIEFKDYSPGLFSDYRVEISGPKDWRSKVQSIDKLAMNVSIAENP